MSSILQDVVFKKSEKTAWEIYPYTIQSNQMRHLHFYSNVSHLIYQPEQIPKKHLKLDVRARLKEFFPNMKLNARISTEIKRILNNRNIKNYILAENRKSQILEAIFISRSVHEAFFLKKSPNKVKAISKGPLLGTNITTPQQKHQKLLALLKCPLSDKTIENPVIALDGHTYEHIDIEAWSKLYSPEEVLWKNYLIIQILDLTNLDVNIFKKLQAVLTCPISFELLKNPVIGPDGNTYERDQIEKWLDACSTSPITRAPMNKEELRPNLLIQKILNLITPA